MEKVLIVSNVRDYKSSETVVGSTRIGLSDVAPLFPALSEVSR